MNAEALDLELLARWPLPSDSDGDKFSRGTVLVIGGSANTPGATILSGTAALRMGAGRLQIATDAGVVAATAVAVPEALVHDYEAPDQLEHRIEAAASVVVGPGLIDADLTLALLQTVFTHAGDEAIVVVDANALELLGDVERSALERCAGRIVLTPNRQELASLAEAFAAAQADSDDPAEAVAAVAAAAGAVVTSFHDTAAPDGRRWRSDAGHPSLGTSGSGDVLAGLIAGAAARCGDAAQAACWGTLSHHLAGQSLGERLAPAGFLARELVDAVPTALAPLSRGPRIDGEPR